MSEPITLRAGDLTATLHPAIGGSLGSLSWRHPDGHQVPLLRTMLDSATNSEGAACFPLLPFSNRIRHGHFTFDGRAISLPRNTGGPHVEHGHGWQRPWSVQQVTDHRATIGFAHDPAQDATWPFAYAAEQHVALDDHGLTVTLHARNTGRRPMPIGFGLHPYFPRTPLCRLQAAVEGFWETDAEILPTRHVAVSAAFDPRRGLAMNNVVVDNCFTGFGGQAVIDWPEFDTRLTMTADTPLRFLTLYVPDAATAAEEAAGIAPYFCAEPVSNITDAANLPMVEHGLITLAPNTKISARVRFQPAVL